MNIKKIAAISLAAIAAGATVGLANAQISTYVQTSNSALSSPMIVLGDAAPAIDVLAAADIAAHVAGYATTDVAVAGAAKSFSLATEGKEVATSNTKIYLDDSLGKSGLRSTMTDSDLPTLLKSGSVVDNSSTTIKYDQFFFLTPSSTTSASYTLQFERPSSSSSDDGTYSIGRFPTSPSKTDYFVNYRLSFKKDASFPNLIGKTLDIAGETYTVLAGSDSAASTPKLVATKSAAAQSVLVSDGTVKVTVGTTTYDIQVLGTSDASTVVVSVNGVSKSAAKSATTNINGVDVYVDDVFHFANNQESSGGRLLIGAEKVTFQNASKIKLGTNEDNVDGTFVVFTQSGGKISTMDLYFTAPASSVTDNLKVGSKYTLPGLSKLAVFFPGISEDLKVSSRSTLKITPSGDNLLQLSSWKDHLGKENTITWAYKASSTGTAFSLADSNGRNIETREYESVSQDEYVVLDAGDFPHLVKVTAIDSNGLSFTLQDVFSGDSTKYELAGSDNGRKTIYIDGQAYHALFNTPTNTTINFTWGSGAGLGSIGSSLTLWPTLKGFTGERLALINNTAVAINATNGTTIQLPTGAVKMLVEYSAGGAALNLSAVTDEDGEASACTSTPCVNNLTIGSGSDTAFQANFTLGKTATGGVKYMIGSAENNRTINITLIGSTAEGGPITQPGLLLFEEKDDASDRYAVIVTATTEASGSNQVAVPAAPIFTATEDSQARGSDSTITDYVDLYGVYAARTTSGQDTLTLYYPDEQVYAVIGAGDASGTASVGGASGSTVKSAIVLTSPVSKLASEVSTTALSGDVILIGGPCANALVATLMNTTQADCLSAWTYTEGIIKEYTNAFGTGKKALVVAGTKAADTRKLAADVMKGTLSYAK